MIIKPPVLIIDSEADFTRMVQQELSAYFNLTLAGNTEDVLRSLKQSAPDIIVLGYLEPPGTSFDLHLKIRGENDFQHIPLLIVDVRPEEHQRKGWTRTQGQQMNVNDYISRPVTSAELKDTIERLIYQSATRPDDASSCLERVVQRIKRIEKTLFR